MDKHILFTFICSLFSFQYMLGQETHFRDSTQVRRLIIGEWRTVDVVYPGVFDGSEEEKKVYDQLMKEFNESYPTYLVLKLEKNGKGENRQRYIKNPKKSIEKRKFNWKLIQNGDILVFMKKSIILDEQLSILSIEQDTMETLVLGGDKPFIIKWKKIK